MDKNSKSNQLLEKLNEIIINAKKSNYYQSKIKLEKLTSLEEMQSIPILTGDDLRDCSSKTPSPLLTKYPHSSYVFSTGGTTGESKIVYRDHQENDFNAQLLAKGLKLGGLTEKDVVANLLAAGNLYTGLLQFNHALEKLNCLILPFGSSSPNDYLLKYLRFFQVSAIIAIPTQIVSFAHYLEKGQITDLKIKRVITGGEHLYPSAKEYLKKILKTEVFQSTGYTSTETGAIGYQCQELKGNIYHLHSDNQYLEILDPQTKMPVVKGEIGNIVVTNLSRKLLPIIRYEIEDLGRLIERKCSCESEDVLFELIGRKQNQIRFGRGFVELKKVASTISQIEGLTLHFQIQLELLENMDKLTILVEALKKESDKLELKNNLTELLLLNNIGKIYDSIKSGIVHSIEIIIVDNNTIPRNYRTGKIQQIIDRRK